MAARPGDFTQMNQPYSSQRSATICPCQMSGFNRATNGGGDAIRRSSSAAMSWLIWAVERQASCLISSGMVNLPAYDRKSVVSGKSVSVRVDLGGSRLIQTKKQISLSQYINTAYILH